MLGIHSCKPRTVLDMAVEERMVGYTLFQHVEPKQLSLSTEPTQPQACLSVLEDAPLVQSCSLDTLVAMHFVKSVGAAHPVMLRIWSVETCADTPERMARVMGKMMENFILTCQLEKV